METTNNVIITLAFADATDRNITFKGVDSEELANVKARVKAINANYPEAMARTFVSAIGAQSTMISKVQLVTVTEEVIYSAS